MHKHSPNTQNTLKQASVRQKAEVNCFLAQETSVEGGIRATRAYSNVTRVPLKKLLRAIQNGV
jgi:hypothetical protein